MSRIRWYHFFFLLAAIDVVVIGFSLEWHRRTVVNVEWLSEASHDMDAVTRWLQRAQQGVLELGEPGNDLFASRDLTRERRRFAAARVRMEATVVAGRQLRLNVVTLDQFVTQMNDASRRVFDAYEQSIDSARSADERHVQLGQAGQAMASLDQAHLRALRCLGLLTARAGNERASLFQRLEAELGDRLIIERYFIAAVVVILLGLLYFGQRMRQAVAALEAERTRVEEGRRERLAAIGELCSSVAHGIRNPLAAIRSSAQLSLELDQLRPDARSRLQDILDETRRLGDRVTGLLNLARVNAGAFSPLSLNDVAGTAVRQVRPEIDRLGLRLELDLPPQDVPLRGDRRQLEQVVIELLSNAMEHSARGGTIAVRCLPPNGDGNARLCVEDDGPGIPPEIRERVFDLFFSTKPTGTGIGLATVKRIARLHEGDVAVDFPVHGGTRFTVKLPAQPAALNGDASHRSGPAE
ncbi:MAG: ATP-binding protein [Phycisphaerae bacterium]